MIKEFDIVLNKIDELPDGDKLHEYEELKSILLRKEYELKRKLVKEELKGVKDDSLTQIYKEAQSVLNHEDLCDLMISPRESSDFISVMDYLQYIRNLYKKWEKVVSKWNRKIFFYYHGDYSNVRLLSFNSKCNSLVLGGRIVREFPIKFCMENGNVRLDRYFTDSYDESVYNSLKKILNDIYNELFDNEKYNVLSTTGSYNIAGTRFYIKHDSKNIYLKSYLAHSNLLSMRIDRHKISLEDVADSFNELVDGRKRELLSNMYLRITDLPAQYQEDLRAIRRESISNKSESLWQKVLK